MARYGQKAAGEHGPFVVTPLKPRVVLDFDDESVVIEWPDTERRWFYRLWRGSEGWMVAAASPLFGESSIPLSELCDLLGPTTQTIGGGVQKV